MTAAELSMTPSPVRGASRPKDRKAQIVAAAATLFAEQGYAAVGIDDIASAVGVTGSAIYRHFPGKEALLTAVILGAAEQIASGLDPEDGRELTVEDLTASAVRYILGHGGWMATYIRERQRLEDEDASALEKAEARSAAVWFSLLRKENPELDDRRSLLRQTAVFDAIASVALRVREVDTARLRDLMLQSALAVWATPVQPGPPPPAEPAWQPPQSRSDELLAAALRLFRDRGFRGVGIDEIGEAVGITGSAVYRHFESKADLLVDANDRAIARILAGTHNALAGATSARDALDRLARSYARVAVDSFDLIVVTARERLAVPRDQQPRLTRQRRAIRDRWGAVLRLLRPDLSDSEVRLLVATVLPLMNTAALATEGANEDLTDEVAAIGVAYSLGTPCTGFATSA